MSPGMRSSSSSAGIFRFLLEADDLPLRIRVHDAEGVRLLALHRDGGNGQVGLGIDVLLEHVAKIHAVKLIAREDDVIIVRILEEIAQVLPHGIGRALVPARVRGRLLRGEDLDEGARELIEIVRRIDVLVQRGGIELREHVDAAQPGIDAIGDRDIDEAIFARERHGRFRALLGQRKEAGARAAAHDDGQRIIGDGGRIPKAHSEGRSKLREAASRFREEFFLKIS